MVKDDGRYDLFCFGFVIIVRRFLYILLQAYIARFLFLQFGIFSLLQLCGDVKSIHTLFDYRIKSVNHNQCVLSCLCFHISIYVYI